MSSRTRGLGEGGARMNVVANVLQKSGRGGEGGGGVIDFFFQTLALSRKGGK